MAESLSPEEIRQAFDAFNKEFLETGKVSRGTTLAFEEAQKGIRNYTFELNKSLKSLGNASLGIGQALLKGEQGASVFNSGLNATADAIEAFLSRFGFWGKMLGTFLTAGSRYVSEVNKQSDQLFQTYQKLSKVGAANASGLANIADSVHKFGLNLNDADIEKFTSLISNNAESLAILGGSVNQGVKTFSDMANEIQNGPLQTEFMRMGLTVTDINNGMAGYLKIQSMTGNLNRQTTQQLTQGAADYVKQLDLLTKLTGKSADALIKEEEANLANERYALVKRDLEKKAAMEGAEGEAARKQLIQNQLLMSEPMSKEMKTGLQNIMAGFGAASEEGAKILRVSSKAFNMVGSGAFETADVMNALKEDSKLYLDQFGGLGKATGDLSKTFISVQDAMKFEGLVGTSEQRIAKAKAEQDAQRTSTDATVANQVAIRQSLREATTAAENLISVGLKPVTAAMSKLAGVTEKVATSLPGTGNTGLTGTGRGTEQAPGFFGKTQPVTGSAPGAASTLSAPAPTAPSAPPPAPPPAPASSAPSGTPVSSTQPPTGDLAQLLKFTGNTGSRSNFNGLDEQLKQAVIQAGAEYNSVTGKNLIINSAKRDSADQKRLYDETVAAGRPGIGPSGMAVGRPGNSLHERGLAVDIQQGKGDQIAIGMLNKQNLFQKVANDPVHFSAREGGILSGPKSGYSAQLHGDEAVIPLSGGRSIPVEMPALTASMNGQLSMMEIQSQQLEELIELMRNNNGISSKILQASKA
jgi:LAS superfamily LD-carboxypeptidase LdcB